MRKQVTKEDAEAMSDRERYTTEDNVTVYEGDLVYDYYGMEPVYIGRTCDDGWFHTESFDDRTKRSKSGMLNGQRICTVEFAAGQDFPRAQEALLKVK